MVIDPGNEMSDDFACSYLIIQSKFSSSFTFLACPLQRFCKLLNKARRKQFGNLGFFSVVWSVDFNLVQLVFLGVRFFAGGAERLFVCFKSI